jgi:hypothetical protein
VSITTATVPSACNVVLPTLFNDVRSRWRRGALGGEMHVAHGGVEAARGPADRCSLTMVGKGHALSRSASMSL